LEIECLLDKYQYITNRIELTFPGKQAILVCEVLSKTSGKDNNLNVLSSKDLEEIAVKLKPYLGNLKIVIRLTVLDGLFKQPTLHSLVKNVEESLKIKKLGTGLNS